MKNILIIMGGQSAEHEVSVVSARNVYGAIDRELFNPILCGISKLGHWYAIPDTALPSLSVIEDDVFEPAQLRRTHQTTDFTYGNTKIPIDCAFPVLHGPFGEDGCIQGYFKILNLPFVGCDVFASAACMDKEMMKHILSAAKIPVVDYVVMRTEEDIAFEGLVEKLGLPFFIKAANLGSSVGVHKVSCESEFMPALRDAFSHAKKVLVEKFIPCREIECAVLGNSVLTIAPLGEIKPNGHHDFYSYEAKYTDPDGAVASIPANIPPHVAKTIEQLSHKVYMAMECTGLSRIDFFYDEADAKIYVNEINTMPGFTSISMYPKMFMHSGMSYMQLISTLIDLGLSR